MRLRTKTLLVVGATLAVLFVVLFAAAYTIVSRGFGDLEQKDATASAGRVKDAVSAELADLSKTAAAWAVRDDTYAFVKDFGKSDFVATKLTDAAVAGTRTNLMLFVNTSGAVVQAKSMGLPGSPDGAVPVELSQSLVGQAELMRTDDVGRAATGVVKLPQGLLLVAARPITDAGMRAAPDGVLIVGRVLDAGLVESMSKGAGLPIVLAEPAQPGAAGAFAAFAEGAAVWTAPVSGSKLAAYVPIAGLDGKPVAALRAELGREAYQQQVRSLGYLLFAMLAIAFAGTGASLFVLERQVLRPLTQVVDQVGSIEASGNAAQHVQLDRNDELGTLVTSINGMLDSLEESDRQVRIARDELELRVVERTEELRLSEERYRSLVEGMADGVLSLDRDGVVDFANSRSEQLTGRPAEELAGMHYGDLVTPTSKRKLDRLFPEWVEAGTAGAVEVEFADADGRAVPIELSTSPVPAANDGVAGVQWIARDITERKRYEAQLQFMAEHDHLTKLLNRKRFEEEIERSLAVARRTGKGGAVLMIDLGDLKDVGAQFGQRAIDDTLVSMADFLKGRMRAGNVLARIGGNAFGVLLPEASAEEAELACGRIMGDLETHAVRVGHEMTRVSAKAGIVTFPDAGTTSEKLLTAADAAVYGAEGASPTSIWRDQLSRALAENLFLVYAQPILDVRTGAVDRYELLIRMMAEDGEVVLPATFLPIAERLGLIRDIDRLMTSAAVRLLERSGPAGPRFDVNLSPKAFDDPELLTLVAAELAWCHVEPSRLGFEITENAAVADVAKAGRFIGELKALGVRVSLDAFGSGFSSFYYLKHLPIDCLKIDGAFIRDLTASKQDRHLVSAIVEMCRALGITCAAEFVEERETLALLPELGVDYAQGFGVGRPKPVEPLVSEWPGSSEATPA